MMIAGVLPLFLAIFFIVLHDVKIRFIRKSITTVRIDFTLLSITLTEQSHQNKYIKNFLKLIKNLPLLINPLHYIVKRSKVTVFSLSHSDDSPLPFKFFNSIPFLLSSVTVLAYLQSNAKSVKFAGKSASKKILKSGVNADVLFHIKLINLIIFALLLVYYKLRSKIRRII